MCTKYGQGNNGTRGKNVANKTTMSFNSEGIKSTALCYLTPVISGRCSIISAKCVCKVKDKALPKAWATVCGKRDLCNRAISGEYLLQYADFR